MEIIDEIESVMDENENQQSMVADPVINDPPAVSVDSARKSGHDLHDDLLSLKQKALMGLPAEWREKLINDAGRAGVRHDNDVGWLLIGSVVDSAAAAFAAGDAANQVNNEIKKLPHVIQNAAISAANDIDGTIKKSFAFNVDAFKHVLSSAIQVGTSRPLDAITIKIGESVNSLTKAVGEIDTEMNKEIIAKREAVLSQWVQSGSDELNRRINEAIKKERNINLGFMLFVIFTTFIFGIVIGYVVSTHVSF